MDDLYIRKVCDGDTGAFRYFIRTYKDMAFTVAVSVVKDECTAQEIVQDAFLKAFNGLRAFNGKSAFRTWFYRIVINEAFMYLKKQKRQMVYSAHGFKEDVADESAVLALREEEQVYLVNEALRLLPAKECLALRLFYLEEESIKAVSELTGWSAANTKVILHRARKNMLVALNHILKSEF